MCALPGPGRQARTFCTSAPLFSMASSVPSNRAREKSSEASNVSRSIEFLSTRRILTRRANAGTRCGMNVLLHLTPEMINRVFDPADMERLARGNTLWKRDNLARLSEADVLITGWGTPALGDEFFD